jgi:putative hemolysin
LDLKIDSLRLIHQSYFVPETTRVLNLLNDFQKQRSHIAVVLDQDKKVSGIITMEDLLEEIFGEIEDEFDKNK